MERIASLEGEVADLRRQLADVERQRDRAVRQRVMRLVHKGHSEDLSIRVVSELADIPEDVVRRAMVVGID